MIERSGKQARQGRCGDKLAADDREGANSTDPNRGRHDAWQMRNLPNTF